MALIRCDFFSDVLELGTSMTVLLPQQTTAQIGVDAPPAPQGPPPLLYLLHGLSDNDTMWLRQTSIERYAAALGLAVVMPQVHRSFYTDMAHGGRFWTFLADELPTVISDFFQVSTRREDTFVAGLSMGGYGAMQWALRRPEVFAAAASLSGALDVSRLEAQGDRQEVMSLAFGGREITGGDSDLFHLLTDAGDAAVEQPAFYVCCGTEDELVEDSRRFVAQARERGLAVTDSFGPGEHEWGYWDATIQDVLAWLFAGRRS
jgi:putative tributyrin esterase